MSIRYLTTFALSSAAIILGLLPAVPAKAAVLRQNFSGIFTEIDDPFNLLGGATTFTGDYTYDTDTPDDLEDSPGLEQARYRVAPVPQRPYRQGLSVTIAGTNYFFNSSFERLLGQSTRADFYSVNGTSGTTSLSPAAQIFLLDLDRTALSSVSPTSDPTNLVGWETNVFSFFYGRRSQFVSARGMLTSLSGPTLAPEEPVVVPEPTMLGGITALGSIVALLKRKRSPAQE